MILQRILCFFLIISSLEGVEEAPGWKLSDPDQGWNAEELVLEYFHHSEPQRQWAWELIGQYPLRGDEHVLDFGCGDGKLTAQLSSHLPQGEILGVDLSPHMISFARRAFPASAYPNLNFLCTQTDHFSSKRFDRVFAFFVFHLIPDPGAVLELLHTCLLPHGDLLLVIPKGGNPAFFRAATQTFHEFEMTPPWEQNTPQALKPSMRTLEGIREILERAGWRIDTLKEVNTPHAFVTRAQFIHWLLGTVTANWGLQKREALPFFERLVDLMEDMDPALRTADGCYHFVLSRVHVVANP